MISFSLLNGSPMEWEIFLELVNRVISFCHTKQPHMYTLQSTYFSSWPKKQKAHCFDPAMLEFYRCVKPS